MIFLDTNILVYAALNQDPEKHRKAALIVRDLLADDNGAISAQVVSEFTNVMFKKTRRTADEIRVLNTLFAPMLRLDMTISLVDRAISLKNGFGIQYYDALIVAAAEKLACEVIYSEDLSDGATYGDVKIVNPFKNV